MNRFFNSILNLDRWQKTVFLLFHDCLIIVISFSVSIWAVSGMTRSLTQQSSWTAFLPTLLFSLVLFAKSGVYKNITRFLSDGLIFKFAQNMLISALFFFVAKSFLSSEFPAGISFVFFLTATFMLSGSRFYAQHAINQNRRSQARPVAIYGAGEAGRQLLAALNRSSEYRVCLFIDDNPVLDNALIHSLRVYKFSKAVEKLKVLHITSVLLAIPSAPLTRRRQVLARLQNINLEIKTMPGMADIIEGRTEISDLKHVNIEELLGRDIIPAEKALLEPTIKNKTVLVTGAGGSIGSELCRQILNHDPNELIVFDHSEHNLYQIERELCAQISQSASPVKLTATLGTIQDKAFITSLIKTKKVNTIYHAAAFKHVPLVEDNSIAAIRNNVLGTSVLAKASIAAGVQHFILISTDKAVRPTNIMGATKRLAELICQSLAKHGHSTNFSMVRFGNVMGSNGSVIPLFREQIEKGGPITVTHAEITRYFMTITEAAQLVIQAAAMAHGGDVFLLDMGKPVKILDLANRMASLHGLKPYMEGDKDSVDGDIEIAITGLRPGEKMHEELLIGDNAKPTSHSRIMTADEKSMDLKALESLLDRLTSACERQDTKTVRDLLHAAPIDYNPSSS